MPVETKVWIKFITDHKEYKKDDIIEVDENLSQKLFDLEIAEETDEPEIGDDRDKYISKFKEEFENLIQTSITASIEKLTKTVEDTQTKIFAVAKDTELEAMAGFESDGQYWLAVIKAADPTSRNIDERLIQTKDTPIAAGIQGVGTDIDSEGGFLVPETMSSRIFQMVLSDPNNFLNRTDRSTTVSNNMSLNGQEQTSERDAGTDNDTGRFAGVRSFWIDEGGEYTASQPIFNKIRMELRKLGVLIYITEEQISDSPVTLGPRITNLAAGAIGYKTDEAFLMGTGAGQPLGIFNADALITVAKQTGQADDTIQHRNINDMYYRMSSGLRTGAIWVVHPDMEALFNLMAFRDVADASHPIPIYIPPGGLNNSPFGLLMGRPVITSQHCHSLGNSGDIFFINWGQYLSLTKPGGGIRTQESIHVRFLFDERVFKFTFRVDGQPGWNKAVLDKNGTTTRSPYITLDYRTESSSSGL